MNAGKIAQDFVAGITWEIFEKDLMRQAATTRQIKKWVFQSHCTKI